MIDMVARRAERERAIALLEGCMRGIAAEGREPDMWERSCIGHGIGAAYRGAYSLATTDAYLTFTPKHERSLQWRAVAEVQAWTSDVLRRALEDVKREPARAFPQFGPIVSARR